MVSASSSCDIASRHISVLPCETLAVFAPLWQEGEGPVRILDGTLGLGGHTQALLEASPRVSVCGLDRDEEALALARQRLAPYGERFHGVHCEYSRFADALDALGWDSLDGALLDIGVSSLQLDEAERGFSFYGDGPLDMRMDQHSGRPSAWHWVNRESFDRLKECIATLGEEPQAGRIARAIVDARQKDGIDTTAQLAALVERAYPAAWRAKARRHPATRTFQALRIEVNGELAGLAEALTDAHDLLRAGGVLAVITFHSLEDRIVKQLFRTFEHPCTCDPHAPVCTCGKKPTVRALTKKPIMADETELEANPRAHSAKLRAIEKL